MCKLYNINMDREKNLELWCNWCCRDLFLSEHLEQREPGNAVAVSLWLEVAVTSISLETADWIKCE